MCQGAARRPSRPQGGDRLGGTQAGHPVSVLQLKGLHRPLDVGQSTRTELEVTRPLDAAGQRIGWIIASNWFEDLLEWKQAMSSATATIPQYVVADFLRSGDYDRHLVRLRKAYREQVEKMRFMIGHAFPPGTRVTDPAGGFVLWVQLPGRVDSLALFNLAIREKIRTDLHEPYRTLLGHFRHESGHYYWDRLIWNTAWLEPFRALFGDERADYSSALEANYKNGPPPDWADRYISSYASTHPWEDWAETWAHYLHIRAALETAAESGFIAEVHPGNWHQEFVDLVLSLNEIMRSLGLPDAYPFVLTAHVAGKIAFIHDAIERCVARNRRGAA